MNYNPHIHHRRSIRLKGYDYSQEGLYFITLCVQDRACLFGEIPVGANPCGCPEMILNDAGKMVENKWLALKKRFQNIELHEYVAMPNHFHAILEIVGATVVVARLAVAKNDTVAQNDVDNGQPQGHAPTETTETTKNKTVGYMIGAFESIVTNEYIRGVKQYGWPRFNGKLWQRNYWEHIIRNEHSHENISNYIYNNPSKWDNDQLKP